MPFYDAAMPTALYDPVTYAHGFPYERFAELREHDPVSHQDHPAWERGFWTVTRHADVQRVSRDWTGFRNAPNPFLPDRPTFGNDGTSLLMISLDPPEHTKLRKIISSGFTPRRINDLARHVKDRVDRVIDSVADQGACDLVRDIALWLPLHAIADLVGVPEADREQVFEWTELTFGFDAVGDRRGADERRDRDVRVCRRHVRGAARRIHATIS